MTHSPDDLTPRVKKSIDGEDVLAHHTIARSVGGDIGWRSVFVLVFVLCR